MGEGKRPQDEDRMAKERKAWESEIKTTLNTANCERNTQLKQAFRLSKSITLLPCKQKHQWQPKNAVVS
jgi:hypothetical protein